MNNRNAFIKIKDIKTPVVLLFIVIYISAVVMVLLRDLSNAIAFIGMSIGMLFLIWLIVGITEKVQVSYFEIKKPGWELIFGLSILIVWDFVPLPKLAFGDRWSLGFILKKNLVFVALPFIFLKLQKNLLPSMGLTVIDWKKNLIIGLIVFFVMAIPSAFYSGTASLILSGKLSLAQLVFGFSLSFIYYFFMSGFSEEFLFRAFIQTRISVILKSRISGILITALLFGLLHIPNIMRWYPGTSVIEAFCRAFFVQTFIGLILGVLWERTRNLIPCVLLHSGIDGLNNLGHIILQFGL